jgi:hypothetical protein
MMTAITRWFSPLLVYLVLTGCSLPVLSMPAREESELSAQVIDQSIESRDLETLNTLEREETELFANGLDQYIESRDLTILKLLPQQYPHGKWRTRAEGIINIAELQQQQQTQLEKTDKELAHSQREKEFLLQDNKILEVTLERLKQVLIDMELRVE